jgi:RNA polymerase sigma-70 factor (ECF subfamily)
VAPPEGAKSAVCCITASAAAGRHGHHTRAVLAGQGRCGAQRACETAPYNGAATFTEPPLASTQEISAFLADVERRAYKQAMFAVRDEQAALDIVQDAMLKLTEKYSQKPPGELPMLFQRILQNTIHDHFRRQKVRSTWTTVLSALGKGDEKDEDFDPLETLPAKSDSNATEDPAAQLEQAQVVGLIEDAIARLPARQREAFLLRYWEELDVAETAAAMGCSEGSVKTHCSRAVAALASMLKAKGIAP